MTNSGDAANPAEDATLTMPVMGMTCTGCETAVSKALLKLPGVHAASASHTDQQITVAYDPALVTPSAIADRIEEVGYIPTRA